MRKFAFFAGILSVCLVAWPGLIRAAGVNQLNQPLLLDSFRNQPFGGFDLTSPSQESAKGELTPQQIAAANAALHLAAQALEKHDLDTAKAKFAEAAKDAPTAPNGFLGLAEVARQAGDRQGIETNLKKALDAAPQSDSANAAWGRYLVTKRDYRGAITSFNKALLANSHDKGILVAEGDLYASVLGNPQKAVTFYSLAAKVDPKDAGVHYALGNTLLAVGKNEAATAELKAATGLEPTNVRGWTALGAAEMKGRDFPSALTAFETAIKLQPKYLGAQLGRADALLMLNRNEDAVAAYQDALKLSPHSAVILGRLGTAQQQAGHLDAAETAYRAAVAANPHDPAVLNDLAYFLAEQGRKLDDALRFAKEAVERAPKASVYVDTLAWVYRARGDLPDAEKRLQPVAAGNPILLYHLGVIQAEMNKKADAIRDFDKALEIAPNYEAARLARQKLAASPG